MEHLTNEQYAGIKLVGLDVDGVLTDGKITYSSDGHEIKSFNVKDGAGIRLLKESGIRIAIITARSSDVVARRAKELNIDYVFQGVKNKLEKLKEITTEMGIKLENVAYMGDDFPDLAIMQSVGLGACPGDAVDIVLSHSLWQSHANGGDGAVREFAEFLLLKQDKLATLLQKYEA